MPLSFAGGLFTVARPHQQPRPTVVPFDEEPTAVLHLPSHPLFQRRPNLTVEQLREGSPLDWLCE